MSRSPIPPHTSMWNSAQSKGMWGQNTQGARISWMQILLPAECNDRAEPRPVVLYGLTEKNCSKKTLNMNASTFSIISPLFFLFFSFSLFLSPHQPPSPCFYICTLFNEHICILSFCFWPETLSNLYHWHLSAVSNSSLVPNPHFLLLNFHSFTLVFASSAIPSMDQLQPSFF